LTRRLINLSEQTRRGLERTVALVLD